LDSWAKSAIVGRVASSSAWVIAGLIQLLFGVILDPEITGALAKAIADTITGACMLYGIATPIISKIRQQKAVEECAEVETERLRGIEERGLRG
jgi:flagellar motor component MotA